jgi:short-subunit dehydrogenase
MIDHKVVIITGASREIGSSPYRESILLGIPL